MTALAKSATSGGAPAVERAARGYIGLSVRCGIDFIEEMGLTEKVRADASVAARQALDNPPAKLGWHDSTVLDELETLLLKYGGRFTSPATTRIAYAWSADPPCPSVTRRVTS